MKYKIELKTYSVFSLAFRKNNEILVSTSRDNKIKLWDLIKGSEIFCFENAH